LTPNLLLFAVAGINYVTGLENGYLTGEEYFAVDCVQNSKYDWCPRVRDWVLEARAQQARERSTGSLGTPDSIRLPGSAQSGNAKRDRQGHSQICREGVRLYV
jgi:hypothetical protein